MSTRKPSMRQRLKHAELVAERLNKGGGQILHEFEQKIMVLTRRCDDLEKWSNRPVRVKVFDWAAGLFG
jgi:hypothetical protein